MTRVLGIDPGLTGALALYDPAADTLRVDDVPTFQMMKGKKEKAYVDLMALARIVDEMCAGEPPPIACVELVSSMPNQGIASTFDFGRTTGILLGVCAAHFLRVEQVPPGRWKRALRVPAGKDAARARASQLLPRHAHLWTRVKDDGRAEAALIALWCHQTYGDVHGRD